MIFFFSFFVFVIFCYRSFLFSFFWLSSFFVFFVICVIVSCVPVIFRHFCFQNYVFCYLGLLALALSLISAMVVFWVVLLRWLAFGSSWELTSLEGQGYQEVRTLSLWCRWFFGCCFSCYWYHVFCCLGLWPLSLSLSLTFTMACVPPLSLEWCCFHPLSPMERCCFGWCCCPILHWCGAVISTQVVLFSHQSFFSKLSEVACSKGKVK